MHLSLAHATIHMLPLWKILNNEIPTNALHYISHKNLYLPSMIGCQSAQATSVCGQKLLVYAPLSY